MEKIVLSTIENGDKKVGSLLIEKAEEKKTRTGKTYTVLLLSDGERTVEGKKWDTEMKSLEYCVGNVCDIALSRDDYNGNASYIVNDVLGRTANADISDYLKCIPDAEKMYQYIVGAIMFCKIPEKQIALDIYNENKEKLLTWSAAKANHHAIRGGLIYHTYRMVRTAIVLKKVYFADAAVNRESEKTHELLVIGAALHDIGKLTELDTDIMGNARYTNDGLLFGHLFIGAEMVREKAEKGSYSEETVKRIVHMIISHHGKMEYGAVRPPMTKEAIMLNFIDDMDAKIYAVEDAVKDVPEGEMSEPVFMLGKTPVYHPHSDN